jgi:signal transduction protein with GAF and PtsI domain
MTSIPDLKRSVAATRALFDAAACSCALVDEDGETLRFAAADGVGAADIVGVEMPVSRGIAGWAVISGQPIAVREVAADARFARDVAESTNYVPTTILAAPLFDDDGEALGVLSVLDPRVDQASDWTLAVLGTVATMVAQLVSAGPRDGAPDLEDLGRRVLELTDAHRAEHGREGAHR